MPEGLNISAFLIGFSTAFFTFFSLYILWFHKNRTRFQSVLGWIMAVWAVSNLKDLIITFPGMYTEEVLNGIMIFDGWLALTYTIFVFEVTMPGWTTLRRLLPLMLPFALFSAWHILTPPSNANLVINAYVAFLWCYAWTIVIIGYIKLRRYVNYIRCNYSNIEDIDVSWLKPVFFFAIISQLTWLFASLYATVIVDILYYLSTLALWLMVFHYSWHFKPITIPEETIQQPSIKPSLTISEEEFINHVVGKGLYLNKNLTLTDLARSLKTNRTYMTSYLHTVHNQTFYDFINQLRIEKKSIPLMQEHPEYTLEYIAAESGFSSISTFRRAFSKFTGKTPSQYLNS